MNSISEEYRVRQRQLSMDRVKNIGANKFNKIFN